MVAGNFGGPNPNLDQAAKISSDVATNFVETFYRALDEKRNTIASYYAAAVPNPDNPLEMIERCDISLNGNQIATPQAMQDLFLKMPESRHEVQSYDCQIVNVNCNIGISVGPNTLANKKDGSKMSFLVMVSGYVEYGGRDAIRKGFSESIVLIPNVNAKGKGDKKWLISSQQFRMV